MNMIPSAQELQQFVFATQQQFNVHVKEYAAEAAEFWLLTNGARITKVLQQAALNDQTSASLNFHTGFGFPESLDRPYSCHADVECTKYPQYEGTYTQDKLIPAITHYLKAKFLSLGYAASFNPVGANGGILALTWSK